MFRSQLIRRAAAADDRGVDFHRRLVEHMYLCAHRAQYLQSGRDVADRRQVFNHTPSLDQNRRKKNGSAAFFIPPTVMLPDRGLPPLTTKQSINISPYMYIKSKLKSHTFSIIGYQPARKKSRAKRRRSKVLTISIYARTSIAVLLFTKSVNHKDTEKGMRRKSQD